MRLPTPELLERYREPHRRYHTLEHVHACLDELKQARGLVDGERRALEAAIWFHDAVFDPKSGDSEDESAELAMAALAGEPAPFREEVARLIRLTTGHWADPADRLGAVMVSIDHTVLASERADYDRYAAQVREEYGFIVEGVYRAGRAALLRRLLAAPAVYPDRSFRERYEARARANIERELAGLSDD